MKKIVDYINEAVEFEKVKSTFGRDMGVVTLLRHEDIDCGNLSEEEFVSLMKADLDKAIVEYAGICKEYNDKVIADRVEKAKKDAIAYAEKKYKKQSYKDKYIQNAIKNAEDSKWFLENPENIFFDFWPEKGQNGIPGVCILTKKSTESQLKQCYEKLQGSKYFKKATGWAFKYESKDKDALSICSFRPYIDVIIDDDLRSEQARDEKRLADSIEKFYAGSNYWGD